MTSLEYRQIENDQQLAAYCDRTRGKPWLAFDTEFVSEHRYRPQLCLIQAATDEELTLIDAMAVRDLTPFWELVAEGVETTIVHAAREESLFCFRGIGRHPRQLFDVQLAAGFVGLEFPSSLSTLADRLLGRSLSKGETRTDWRLRPLSRRQVHYALQDVQHLEALHRMLHKQLVSLGRLTWYEDELSQRQREWEHLETELPWQRLQGLSRMSPRSLAIARQLYVWRDGVAQRQERAPRRILPDDLIVEIAKRGESDVAKLRDIRGLAQRVNNRLLPEISEQVRLARQLPESQLPVRADPTPSVQLGLLGQFLTTGLALVCAEHRLAPSLVATAQEIRELAAWRMGLLGDLRQPLLMTGWRGEIVGAWVDEIIQGNLAIRVKDPNQDPPLTFEPWRGSAEA